jgi:hypothetical protein
MASKKTTLPVPEEMVSVLEKEGEERYSETIRETGWCCPAPELESVDEPGLVVEQVLKAALSRLHLNPAIGFEPW